MAHSNDILSVIILALVCIVIAAVLHKLAKNDSRLIAASLAFVLVATWICYDYILLNRYKAKEACMKKKYASMCLADLSRMVKDSGVDADDESPPEEPEEESDNESGDPEDGVEAMNDTEVDIGLHQGKSIEEMYRFMASPGDTKIANRMKYMGMQAQLSKDIRAGWNAESMRPWLEAELRDHAANREWWNSDFLETELGMF